MHLYLVKNNAAVFRCTPTISPAARAVDPEKKTVSAVHQSDEVTVLNTSDPWNYP